MIEVTKGAKLAGDVIGWGAPVSQVGKITYNSLPPKYLTLRPTMTCPVTV